MKKYLLIVIVSLFVAVTIFAQPTITSFAPTSGPIGTEITITGTNFSNIPANNIVYFGAVKAAVTAATTTALKVNVPIGTTYQPLTITTNGLTAYSAKPFIVTFEGVGDEFDSSSFAPKIDYPTGIDALQVCIADFDGDGKPDLVVIADNINRNRVTIFRNTSSIANISFTAKVDIGSFYEPRSVAIGDIDGDGKLDMAIVSFSGTLSILRNTSSPGTISFDPQINYASSYGSRDIAIADFDKDGKPDLAVSCASAQNVGVISIFKNLTSVGIISFASKVDYFAGDSPGSISSVDLDGDKKYDLAVVRSFSNNTVSAFLNTSVTGNISLADKIDFTVGSSPWGGAAGDIDGDEKPELAVVNMFSASVSVLKNNSVIGAISFAPKTDFTIGGFNVAIGDLNGDGKPDIAVVNIYASIVSLLKNTSSIGAISFLPHFDYVTGTYPYWVSIGDLDGDGRPDLVVANSGSKSISILRNQMNKGNICISPSGLKVTNITDASARLHWTLPDSSVCALQIRYRPVGSSEWMRRLEKPAKNYIVLRSLLSNAKYEWKIRSICGADTTRSSWAKGPDFTTAGSFASTNISDALTAGKFSASISPNPVTSNVLTLHILNATANNYQLSIADMQGRTYINQNLFLKGISNKTIDVAVLPKGVYILKIINNKNEQQQKKFVKAN